MELAAAYVALALLAARVVWASGRVKVLGSRGQKEKIVGEFASVNSASHAYVSTYRMQEAIRAASKSTVLHANSAGRAQKRGN